MTMGAPLFGSAQDFIDMMKGAGMLGPILKGMGMQPVKFLSEAEFAKTITTESKVFSIYSIGVIKGYKREVRLRLQEVVDFRNTPNLSATPTPTTTGATTTTPPPTTTSGANAAAIVQPATGGNVIYFRID
jgi:general secretion pathway protein K